MDVSYLLHALRFVRDEATTRPETNNRPMGYQEAIEWLIDFVDTNWFDGVNFDAILEAEDAERQLSREGF